MDLTNHASAETISNEEHLAIMRALPAEVREFLMERATIPFSVKLVQIAVRKIGAENTLTLLMHQNVKLQKESYGTDFPATRKA